jgi:hypothetical protein
MIPPREMLANFMSMSMGKHVAISLARPATLHTELKSQTFQTTWNLEIMIYSFILLRGDALAGKARKSIRFTVLRQPPREKMRKMLRGI